MFHVKSDVNLMVENVIKAKMEYCDGFVLV